MKLGINLTDYKIRSIRVYRLTVITFGLLLAVIFLAELIVDLRSTSMEILIPFTLSIFFVVILSFRFSNSKSVKVLFTFIIYLMMEVHFLYQPTSFHVVIWWFPFVPLIALIILGIRSSLVWMGIILISLLLNSVYLSNTLGDSYEIEIFRIPFLVSALIFSTAIIANSFILYHLLGKAYFNMDIKNKQLVKVRKMTARKKKLLEHYMKEFIEFSKDNSNFNNGQIHLFKSICEKTSMTLNVNRVSIWLFEESGDHLVRRYLYEASTGTEDIIKLKKTDFPVYFEALSSQPFIMASKARHHRHTKEFTDSYLIPSNIYSILDCPIMVDMKAIGVICCENQFSIKEWNIEDTLFIQSFADFIAMSHKNARIEGLMNELKQSNEELIVKNKEIELINAALDTTVRKRTKALKTTSAQLTEYSFINSHLLRAPLSRILGLSEAIHKDVTSSKEKGLIDALLQSSNELDNIIRKINEVLYDGNGLTRKDLEVIERDVESKRA